VTTYPPPTAEDVPLQKRYNPLPAGGAREVVLRYIHSTFKDPDAIKDLEIGEPELTRTPQGDLGWSIIFSVNGKNSFGAYTGATKYQIIYSHAEIVSGTQLSNL
jgi:hypothetical protein